MTRTEEIRARVAFYPPGSNCNYCYGSEHYAEDVPYLLTELTALREEVERLKGALEKYGYHEHGCSFRPTRAGRITGVPCDCGLHKAALSPSPAQEQP